MSTDKQFRSIKGIEAMCQKELLKDLIMEISSLDGISMRNFCCGILSENALEKAETIRDVLTFRQEIRSKNNTIIDAITQNEPDPESAFINLMTETLNQVEYILTNAIQDINSYRAFIIAYNLKPGNVYVLSSVLGHLKETSQLIFRQGTKEDFLKMIPYRIPEDITDRIWRTAKKNPGFHLDYFLDNGTYPVETLRQALKACTQVRLCHSFTEEQKRKIQNDIIKYHGMLERKKDLSRPFDGIFDTDDDI